jgi:hypothetical protein
MSTTPDLVGGGGGDYFSTGAVGKVKSVNLRSGKYIDSIQLVYTTNQVSDKKGRDGGDLGSFTADVTLPANEVIVGVEVLYGKYIDNLRFITNKGKATSFGGNGKDTYNDQLHYYPVEAKKYEFSAPPGNHLVGMQGRSGKYLDAFAPIWGTNP